MWNFNIKRGAIWSVKSVNENEEYYVGMTGGSSFILILDAFTDEDNVKKFIYLKINPVIDNFYKYKEVLINNQIRYLNLNNMYMGDQRALEKFECNINSIVLNDTLKYINQYFNFKR